MNKTIDMQPEHLKLVQAILSKYLPSNAHVWVFGSRAKKNAKKFSDLDLAIELPNGPLSLPTLALLDYELKESSIPYKIDIVDWSTLDSSFREAIKPDRVLLSLLKSN